MKKILVGFISFTVVIGLIVAINFGRDGQNNVEPTPTSSQMSSPESMALALAEKVIGLTEEEAIKLIENESGSITYRVVKRDGESFAVTLDYRLDRVNLEINQGLVTYAYVG